MKLPPGPASLLAAFALALSASTMRADQAAPSVEERLSRLEAAIARIERKLGDTEAKADVEPTIKEYHNLAKALGWDGKTLAPVMKPAGKEKSLAVGGFVQANYEAGGVNAPDSRFAGINDRFELRRARINVTGSYAEDISFKLETDLGANTLSNKSGFAGQLTDAYISWTKVPEAGLRFGQFKTPFGFEQLLSDTKIYTIERSLPNDKLTVGRQVGAMAYGDLADKRLSYSVAAFNGTGTNDNINDNQKFMGVARVAAVVVDTQAGGNKIKLTTGADYFDTRDRANTTLATTFTGHRDGTSVDAQLVYGPAEIQAEWIENELHPLTGTASKAAGWALLGALNLTSKWQGVVRYESYDSNTHVGNTTTDLWTFGVNYLIKGDDLKLSLDYLSGEQPSPAPHGDRLLGRMQVVF